MLNEQIDRKRKEIFTDSYPMSIGELSNLYRDGEIYINPEFQRFYRWTHEQKVKLIESLLLGIPLPSIFVAQRSDGIWDLVDGLQRMSTIFSFMGILKGPDGVVQPPLTLLATDDLPGLGGISWDSPSFDAALKISFKREKIDVKIIKKESDVNTKFELFQRLNTGGSNLSDQEVRNCLLIMLNPDFFELILDMSRDAHFTNTISITDRLLEERFDMELVLRFLIQNMVSLSELSSIEDISPFLTNNMKTLASDSHFNVNSSKNLFVATFRYVNEALGDNAYRKWDGTKYKGSFSIAIFEVVTSGVFGYLNAHQELVNEGSEIDGELIATIRRVSKELPNNPIFTENSGSGIRATYRLPKLIPLGRELIV